MKKFKILAMLLALVMVFTLFAGCGSESPEEKETEAPVTETKSDEVEETEATEGAVQCLRH